MSVELNNKIVKLLDEADALKLEFINKGYIKELPELDAMIKRLEQELIDEEELPF